MDIAVGCCPVVDVVVLHLEAKVAMQLDIRTDAVYAACRSPSGIFAEDVVPSIYLQPVGYGHSYLSIPGICFIRTIVPSLSFGIEVVDVPAFMMCIFGTDAPVVMLVDGGECPAATADRDAVFTGESACPSEEPDVEVLDGLHLYVAYPVLLRVVVLAVLSITVIDGCLIANQPMLVQSERSCAGQAANSCQVPHPRDSRGCRRRSNV